MNIIPNKSKGRLAIIFLQMFYIPLIINASPLFSDIKVTSNIGPEGGNLMAEDTVKADPGVEIAKDLFMRNTDQEVYLKRLFRG